MHRLGQVVGVFGYHDKLPSKKTAAVFFKVGTKAFGQALLAAFSFAGPGVHTWTHRGVKYQSTFEFKPPSAVVVSVVEDHKGHPMLEEPGHANRAMGIDYTHFATLRKAGMGRSAIQKQIYEKHGVFVRREDIENRMKKADADSDATWNATLRDSALKWGILDPTLTPLNAYTTMLLRAAASADKMLVALIATPGSGRGHDNEERVLISPLGSTELYWMTEAEFHDITDPGNDGVS